MSAVRAVFIVGAQKAGTTYLHNLLASAPEFASCPDKEPHFFSSSRLAGLAFEDVFPSAPDASFLLDSSASYLHTVGTAERIAAVCKDPLVIINRRDPLKRALSAYQHNAKNGRELRPLQSVFALEGQTFEEVREEETAQIEAAMRAGQIVLRPEYEGYPGDQTYYDPFWTFRYASNSFHDAQEAPFRRQFKSVVTVDFEELIKMPQATVNRLRTELGLPGVASLEAKVGTNPTIISRPKVLRKYLRNLHYNRRLPAPMVTYAASAMRAMLRGYDTQTHAFDPGRCRWVAHAGTSTAVVA